MPDFSPEQDISWTPRIHICQPNIAFRLIYIVFSQSAERSNMILFLTDGDPTDSEVSIYQAIEDGQASMVRFYNFASVTA